MDIKHIYFGHLYTSLRGNEEVDVVSLAAASRQPLQFVLPLRNVYPTMRSEFQRV